MLAILTCHFNPIGYERQRKNAECFYQQMTPDINHHVHSVEAVFDGQSVSDNSDYAVNASHKNIMWQKERMLNLALERLPACYDKVAWIDADLIFTNPYWYEQTEENLKHNAVCQMFSAVSNTNQQGELIDRVEGVGWRMNHKPEDRHKWYRPGGAWAARREIAECCISDEHVTGGGDCATAFAWTGEPERWARHISYCPRWDRDYSEWAEKQRKLVDGRIGYVPGDVVHLWHGDKGNRQYNDRAKLVERHNFDPLTDIRIGENGLWEWATDKPQLHNAVRKYFVRRKEDG